MLKRWPSNVIQSVCKNCGAFLCVTAGKYTGTIDCYRCREPHIFVDSLVPVGAWEPLRAVTHGD